MNSLMKLSLILVAFISLIFCEEKLNGQVITTGTLLDEMINLKRLAEMPEKPYEYVQYSSYDRRSTKVSEQGWFANSDGFGNEPIPGFEEVLKAPGEDGVGDYLICDVKGPGAILRLWTARMYGEIRLFLDGNKTPVYKGNAQDFFWETAAKLSDDAISPEKASILRQYDATYFPIPFAKSCRIEWTGNLKRLHFYHVGIRFYEPQCKVETFNHENVKKYLPQLEKVYEVMKSSDKEIADNITGVDQINTEIQKNSKEELFVEKGSGAIEYLSLKVEGSNLNEIMRQNILNIYFDGSPSPQVQSPVGDFFGAAPGINPYYSMPFSVYPDGTMECRFFMPYKDSVRIEIQNISDENIKIIGRVKTSPYKWEDGKSMHFRAKWRIDHNLTASDTDIVDVPYLVASGQGRVVGAATYLLNPSNAPRAHGNWWGEGDEKIFLDDDSFPSFFGTGTEDYYNYSWSSPSIFSYPYCGQPRNDGPGNRGFVCNYRWHILDDIIFYDKISFYIELLHHGVVPGFAYGRMVYLYSLPGLLDDHMPVSKDDVQSQNLTEWRPIAYKGSAGYRFYQAEDLNPSGSNINVEDNILGAGGKIMMWSPKEKGDKISFLVPNNSEEEFRFVITFAQLPEGGKVSVYLNGKLTELKGQTVLNLFEPHHKVIRNYTSAPMSFKDGAINVTVKYVGEESGKKVGVDFIWVKE